MCYFSKYLDKHLEKSITVTKHLPDSVDFLKETYRPSKKAFEYNSSFYTKGVAVDDIMRDFEKYGV